MSKNETPLDLLTRHVASLEANLAELKKSKSAVDGRLKIDHQRICSKYVELSECLEASKYAALKRCSEIYAAKTEEIRKTGDVIHQRIKDAKELKGMSFVDTQFPEIKFEVQLNISFLKKKISELNVKNVIKETDGFVKEEPGPAAAVKTEPVCPSSGSLFELPTARESIKKIHTIDHIFHKVINPEQFSDSEDDREGQESPTKKCKVSTPGDGKVAPKQSMDKIRDFILCRKCKMRRCVYSDKKLTNEQMQLWKEEKEKLNYNYNCSGRLAFSANCELNNILQVEDDCVCHQKVNIHYYNLIRKFPLVCYVCASKVGLTTMSEEEKFMYNMYHPVCLRCKKNGDKPRVRRKCLPRPPKLLVALSQCDWSV